MQGFKTMNREVQVAVSATDQGRLQAPDRAICREEVTVEGAAPVIEFSDKLNSYVDQERINEMPLNGRDFNALLSTVPGVQRAPRGRLPVDQHQRPAQHLQQLHDRRHLEQRPLLRRHRHGRDRRRRLDRHGGPLGRDPGVHGPADAGRRVRSQGRGRDQRRHEERHQRVPRLRLLLPPRRLDGREELLHREGRRRQAAASRTSSSAAPSAARWSRTRRSSSATTRASASRSARPTARSCPPPTRSRRPVAASRPPAFRPRRRARTC